VSKRVDDRILPSARSRSAAAREIPRPSATSLSGRTEMAATSSTRTVTGRPGQPGIGSALTRNLPVGSNVDAAAHAAQRPRRPGSLVWRSRHVTAGSGMAMRAELPDALRRHRRQACENAAAWSRLVDDVRTQGAVHRPITNPDSRSRIANRGRGGPGNPSDREHLRSCRSSTLLRQLHAGGKASFLPKVRARLSPGVVVHSVAAPGRHRRANLARCFIERQAWHVIESVGDAPQAGFDGAIGRGRSVRRRLDLIIQTDLVGSSPV
jgi:hypothetical protein